MSEKKFQKPVWPKAPTEWIEEDSNGRRARMISVPFTWNLPALKQDLRQSSFLWDYAVVGGPAVELMPDYLRGMEDVTVSIGIPILGVLQRINPLATRTTTGCVRKCKFCAVPDLEGDFSQRDFWHDGPIVCDNNILASNDIHFGRVCDRLEKWGWADFNQGLDVRLLTDYHAERIRRIGEVMCRLALDSARDMDVWENAYSILRRNKIPKNFIRSLVLIGHDTGPEECWSRCEWIDKYDVPVSPMWFHELDALEQNAVTPRQEELGWDDFQRREIMQWYYRRKKVINHV